MKNDTALNNQLFPEGKRRRLLAKGLVICLLFLGGSELTRAHAQTSALYTLNKPATFQQGCFPPCTCPEMINLPIEGTFLVTPTGFDGLFYTYAVTEVNWLLTLNGTPTLVTGMGTYKVGGEFALQQQLTLDLQIGEGGTPQHFDSGLVKASTSPNMPFPGVNIIISINGQICLDTVFTVDACPTLKIEPPRPPVKFSKKEKLAEVAGGLSPTK